MARPKSKDPVEQMTVTVPKSIKKAAQKAAEEEFVTLSHWVTMRIREYFLEGDALSGGSKPGQ